MRDENKMLMRKCQTGDAVITLMDMSSTTALIVRGDKGMEVDIAEVRLGDTNNILPACRVSVDGVIVEGILL